MMYLGKPPQLAETRVFSSMPRNFVAVVFPRNRPDANRGGHRWIVSSRGRRSTVRDLYVVDIPFGRIFRISRDGIWSLIIEYDGWPIGLKIAPDGRVLVADYMNGLMELDPQRDTISPLLGHRNCESFRGCNDLHIATNGDIYFTIRGKLDCTIRPAGCSDCVLTAGSIA